MAGKNRNGFTEKHFKNRISIWEKGKRKENNRKIKTFGHG